MSPTNTDSATEEATQRGSAWVALHIRNALDSTSSMLWNDGIPVQEM